MDDDLDTDQRQPHQMNPSSFLSADDLNKLGVLSYVAIALICDPIKVFAAGATLTEKMTLYLRK